MSAVMDPRSLALPRSPAECGGRLGEAQRRLRERGEIAQEAHRRLRALIEQEAGYRQTVATANEHSDMGAVSASLAGIQVVEKLLPPARLEVDNADANYRSAEDMISRDWSRAQLLLRMVRGEAIGEERYLHTGEPARLLDDLTNLVGPL